ncbi:phage head closure protein [Paenibacillus ginsengarvi]|uniref:Head-tail adaptor protein n=1 Tax=Paenibacillus ginsengarvi TaxID=400777 RepID=A0A3B0CYN2_9BACL|nr:phage head closure protein [Paenibacillus ginsengarvi]RKN86746.1 head-tail adaptor protein [Paenibacillus ginsengarvi]
MSCYNCGDKKDNLTERLNKMISILRPRVPDDPAPDVDEYGQPIDNPVIVVPKLWAGIEPLQGRELYAAMRENAEVTTRIPIRWRTGVDRTMFVRYKEMEFEILYIIHPKFDKKELHLMCKERQ